MFLLNVIIVLLTVWSFSALAGAYAKRKRLTSIFDKLPGPPLHPIHPVLDTVNLMLINELTITKHSSRDSFVLIYELARAQCKLYEHVGLFKWYLGFKPVVVLFAPEHIEPILTSTSVLNKADEYRVFEPWIGEGLVTSKRNKWQFRRKILTPAFHFRILNDFLPVMNQEATKLVDKLTHVKYRQSFDVTPVIALCTLDIICETAMGVNINCQANEHSDYVRSLYEVGEMSLARVTRPWLWPDFIFWRTRTGNKFQRASECMHKFTRRVILDRKAEWDRMLRSSDEAADNPTEPKRMTFEDFVETSSLKNSADSRRRLAFLDLLMHQHLVERNITIEDIREEVDTFMFAGHDTTAMNISWTLYMLGLHEDKQARARRELDEIFVLDDEDDGGLRTRDITSEHLAQMKYLEMVIKEALRMFPPIPFVARQMSEDVKVGRNKEYLIPEGSTCMIFTHALHHNSKCYPKPEVFEPERFLAERTNARHPFAYIPFSGGPRNCIGQKFAQVEVKVILAKLLRNYHVKSTVQRDKLQLVGELVLRSTNGLHVRLVPRFPPRPINSE